MVLCSIYVACSTGVGKCNSHFNILMGDNPTNVSTVVDNTNYLTWSASFDAISTLNSKSVIVNYPGIIYFINKLFFSIYFLRRKFMKKFKLKKYFFKYL